MTIPAAFALVDQGRPPRDEGGPVAQKIALSRAERAAACGMATGEAAAVHVQERATALASGDPGVRRRSLARAAAVHEQQLGDLAALLAAAVSRGDARLVATIDRTLTSATHRYRALMEQLRIESSVSQRITMLAQGPVAISAEVGP